MKKLSILFLLLFVANYSLSQVQNSDLQVNQVPNQGFQPCGVKDTTNVIGVVSKINGISDVFVTIKLPEGVLYTGAGNFAKVSGPAGLLVSEFDITNLSQPVFAITGTWSIGDFVEFSFERTAECVTIMNSINGEIFKDSLEVRYDNGTDSLLTDYDNTARTYTLDVAVLGVQPITSVLANVGDTVIDRNVNIVQGGVGCTKTFVHKVAIDTNAIRDYVLRYKGVPLTIHPSSTSDTFYYYIDLSLPIFISDVDSNMCFDNGETITFEESFIVVLCEQEPVRHTSYYGCFLGQNCQSSDSQPGNITLGSELPDITISNVSLPAFASLCDTTWLTYRIRNNNTNSGAAALDILLEIGRGGNSVPLTTFSSTAMSNHTSRKDVVMFKVNDTIIPITLRSALLPGPSGTSAPDIAIYNLLTFDPDSAGVGLEDLDGDGFFDDLPPGEEFEFTYGYVVDPVYPATCGIAGAAFVNWEHMYTQVVHRNQCGVERPAKKIDYNYNYFGKNYAGAVSELVAPTDLDPYTDSNFTVSVSTHFNRSGYGCGNGIDEEYEVRIVLPAGITWDSVTAPNLSASLNPTFLLQGDTFVYRISGPYNTAGSSRIFEFPLKLNCAIFQSTELNLSYISRYRCLTGCLEEDIECSTLPSINTHCPTSCRGIVTRGFEANRTTAGYTDNTKTTLVTLDTAIHNTKYYLHGDTMLVKTFAVIKDTVLANAHIEISYSGVSNLTFGSGQIIIDDISTPGTVSGNINVAPTYIVSGGRKRFDFDLSSYRGLVNPTYNYGEGTEADTIWLELKFAVTGTSFSNPVDHPFTSFYGRFYFIESGGNERACDKYGDLATMNHAWVYATEWSSGRTFTECATARIRSGIYARIFNGQTFPNEYRPPYTMDSVVFILPTFADFIPNSATFTGGWTETAGDVLTIWDSITRRLIVKPAGSFVEPDFGSSFMHAEIGIAIKCGAPASFTSPQMLNTTVDWRRFSYSDSAEVINQNNIGLNNVNFVKPTLFLQSPNPTSQGTQLDISWDIQVDKTSAGTTNYNWLRIEKVPGISIDSIFNITSGSEVPVNFTDTAGYLYAEVDTFSGISTHNFRLKATYTTCLDRSFDVNVGWDCRGYPSDYSDVNIAECYDNTLTLALEPKNSIVTIDVNDTSTNTPVTMCQPFEIEMKVFSTDVADVVNPTIEFDVPGGLAGLTIDSVLIEYPLNSGNFQNVIADSISPNRLRIDLRGHTLIDSIKGIFGTANNSGADGRTVGVKIVANTTCDYIAGSSIQFSVYGEKPCSGNADGNASSDVSERITIAGALKNYQFFTEIIPPADGVTTCEQTYKFTYKGTFFSFGTDTTLNDTATITLPFGLKYFSDTNRLPDSIRLIYSEKIGERTRLYYAIPNGMSSGDQFEIDIYWTTNVGCDLSAITAFSTFTVASGVYCGTDSCASLKTETSNITESFVMRKPYLDILESTATSTFVDSVTEKVSIYLSQVNVDTTRIHEYTINVFSDLNSNFFVDSGLDTLIYTSGPITKTVLHSDTSFDTLMFNISNLNTCQYIVQYDTSSCMCFYDLSFVNPVRMLNSGTDTSLCENTSIVIGGPTGVGLTYLWTGADAGTFSDSSLSNPTYNPLDVNSLIIDEVYLTTTRPSGCSTTDTLLITVYPAPNVSIIDDTTTCGIDSIILFSGGGDSYLWNTGSTDSNITVLPNTTTTYSVTISNTFGCSIDTGVTVTVLDAIRDVLVIDSIYPTCAYKGSITVLGSPTGTYEFSITSDSSGFQLSPTFTNLDTGTYTIWGRNTINPQCVAMSSPVVLLDTIPPLALDTSYFTPVSICGGATNRGSITAQVTGGLGTITYNLTGSFTASNTTGVFPNLLAGIYTVTATDSIGCSIDLVSDLWLPELNCDTLYRGIPSTGGTDSTCVANPGTGGPYTINTCDGSGTSSSGIALSFSNTCVTYATTVSPFQGDTACIIICDTIIDTTGNISVIVCDTTTLIYYPIPTPDTIVTVLPPGKPPVLVCADTSQHLGTSFTYSPCGGPTYGTMNRTLGNCYTYISFFDRIDTACVVICDEYGVCDTTIFIYVPPVTPDTVITTDTVVCVDTNDLLGAMVDSIVTCDGSGMSSNGGGVTIDPITGCVSTSPVFTGGITDTTCVVVCKTVAGVVICDTTIIVTVQPPTPDTIVQLTNGTTTDSCITTSQLVGSTYTYTSCGAPSHGTMSNVDSCYRYVPTTNLLDTACTIICDEYGVCDTTIFIYVPPVTPDTVITTDTVVCVDTNDLLGAMVDSIVTCDGSGMSSNGGGVTIDPITGCVSTIPVFTGGITDTTCVVVCKTVAGVVICDTTIIVTVQPPTPDTIVQLTNGTTTDSCITTSQLVGSTYTYTSCGAPSHGTMSNVDSCYRYVPTTNLLDTACTIICDEYGVCDTTIFIYVPPVTPDTVITTDTVVCVDTNDLLGAMVDSIVTCDGSGMSSNGGGVTIDPITGCVSTIPVFTGGITDTTCVVVCKTVAGVVICDTTIIVTVQPPTPDTIVQLTNGTTTDSCITTSQLVGSTYTYTSCGAPSHGTMSNVDSCYRYVPTTNLLDTACTIICDEYGVCDTTIFIYVPPVTPDTVITTDTVVCVDTNDLLGAMVDSIVTCDGSGMSSNGGGVTIDPITGCVSTIPVFTGGITDTTCVVVCKTVAGVVICDTTIIVTVQPPTPDTIVQLTNGTPVDTCLSQSELLGSMYTYTSCGNPVHGVLTNNTDTCFNYSPITNTLDTACVVICDEYGVCDTTIFIYVPPVTPDTVITTDTVVCVDTNDLLGAMVDSIVTCDGSGMSSNGGGVTIDPITGCVSTIPVFTGGITDTTCVVVCKTVAGVVICDTTIIVTVQPPTPDTIVQLTNGTTTDSCITTSQLVGSTYTYTSCGAPSHGTMSNVDSCYRYVPTTNLLDTACTIICDEYGVCDTTIFIYVPPVTPDTVITTDTVVCVDTNDLLGAMVDSIVTCDGSGMSSNGGGVTIDPITGCVSTIPVFTGGITDTTCVVVCKTVAGVVICDTTIIVTVQPPTPDTIVQLTNGTTTDSCITTSQLVGSTYTYTSCGAPSHGTMSNVDSCYRYVPTTNLLDTACTIICDEYGVCDTTIFIYVPPVTPDTVITTDTVVCVDTNDLLGAMVDSIVTCDGSGMSSNGGGVTIDPITGCVSTSPVFTGGITDTTCVVVCKTVAGVVICDTTIIVTVQPPTPDTIIQLTNGMPVDTCLSQSELLGSMYTYTSCGNPVHGVLTNNTDTCFNYSPITNTLDTACVVICDEYGVCDTTIFIYVPPVTPDTIYSTDTVVCVDTTEMPAGFDTATGCDGMNPTMTRNGGTATIDAQGCVTISPVFVGLTDTTCIIICDTVFGLCDTTIIITKRPSVPDTIVDCIPRDGQANDSSMNTNDLLGPIVSTSVIQLPKHGQFTLTNDTSSSYQTSPFPILDTVTVAICDQYSCCDTFTFIYIPPMTVDTIKQQGGGTVCVDTTEMPAGRYTSIGTCDGLGMTSNGGPVTPLSGGCVSITPDFSVNPIDTTCIILCDTVLPMCECDTTYVISFRPTIPDTFAIQLPKGTNTADTCLTTSELFGTSYTYRRLGAPTPHGPVTTHNDTCINYVQTSTTKYLDTARVLICDECGNCDTTVIIYVPTPDPDTLLVGPVIPVTNVDTCVRLESTYMTGHYINTCDSTGTTSGGVPVTITGLCVRYPVPAPVFTGDTACIIVCDTIRNVTICDTTLIIYLPDTTPPTVVCKDDTVYLDNLGTVMIDTSNVLDTVYDNTLVHSVTVAPTMFNCSNVGVNLVTVTATDTNRNVDSCIARVTVLDTVPPTAICQNITIQLDSNGNASITAFDVDGGSTDNCAIASLVVNQTSFDCSHLGMNTVVLTVTDIHGNVSTCTATVTVEDNISPITYCPSDKQIVVRNTMCSYILPDYTGEASAWDNCLGNGVTITQTPAAGSEVFLENTDTTITLTATDGSGNISTCSFQLYARCVKELNIPQFFSPDGNGQNDTWEIPELANYPNNTVKVFNRWGNLVFEQKGYYTGWDGRSNVDRGVNRLIDNKVLPEGTYFYIIDLGEDGSIEPYVGYMQLKR